MNVLFPFVMCARCRCRSWLLLFVPVTWLLACAPATWLWLQASAPATGRGRAASVRGMLHELYGWRPLCKRRGDAREMQLNLLWAVWCAQDGAPLRLFCCIAAICSCPSTAARPVNPPLACGDGSVLQTKKLLGEQRPRHHFGYTHRRAKKRSLIDPHDGSHSDDGLLHVSSSFAAPG